MQVLFFAQHFSIGGTLFKIDAADIIATTFIAAPSLLMFLQILPRLQNQAFLSV